MRTRAIATAFSATALLGAVVLPAGAAADYYVPPGNSAVNQYTESFPGAGGETSGKNKKDAVPAETIGAGNAKKLEEKGVNGREAAEVAAETAPPADLYAPANDESSQKPGKQPHGGSNTGGGSADVGGNSGGGQQSTGTQVSQPSGSSGLGSVLGQATGTGGDIGLWLPLAIVLTVIGALAYRLRHRPQQPA
jgi:hypothetical protein